MTLAQCSEEYVRLRALAVKAAYDNNPALLSTVGEKLRALPSFHYEYGKVNTPKKEQRPDFFVSPHDWDRQQREKQEGLDRGDEEE